MAASAASAGRVAPDAVERERDRHDERGVPHEPALDVDADEGGKPGLLENALQVPDPGTGAAVRLTEHRLLLTDQHVPDDRAVPGASGRRETEQGTLPRAAVSSACLLAVLPKNSTSESSVMPVRTGRVLRSCSARTGTSTRSKRSSARARRPKAPAPRSGPRTLHPRGRAHGSAGRPDGDRGPGGQRRARPAGACPRTRCRSRQRQEPESAPVQLPTAGSTGWQRVNPIQAHRHRSTATPARPVNVRIRDTQVGRVESILSEDFQHEES